VIVQGTIGAAGHGRAGIKTAFEALSVSVDQRSTNAGTFMAKDIHDVYRRLTMH